MGKGLGLGSRGWGLVGGRRDVRCIKLGVGYFSEGIRRCEESLCLGPNGILAGKQQAD